MNPSLSDAGPSASPSCVFEAKGLRKEFDDGRVQALRGVRRLCEEINRLVPEARAMVAGEHVGNSEAYRFIRAMSWGTSLLAVILGVLLGAVGVKLMETMPAIHGLLEPDLSVGLFVISVAIAVAVGVVSGLYPAWRSSRLTPGPAMQA